MTEQLLDESYISAAFEHVRGAGVPEQVATAGAADVGLFDPFGDHSTEDVGVEGFAVAGEDEGAFVCAEDKPGADFVEVAFEPGLGAGTERDDLVFVAFALANGECLAFDEANSSASNSPTPTKPSIDRPAKASKQVQKATRVHKSKKHSEYANYRFAEDDPAA